MCNRACNVVPVVALSGSGTATGTTSSLRKASPLNITRLASRVAVGGVSAALATAGLVGVTSPSQPRPRRSARPTTAPRPPARPSRSRVHRRHRAAARDRPGRVPGPAGLLSFQLHRVGPRRRAQQLLNGAVNNTGAKSDDFGTSFGTNVAKAPVAWTKPAAVDLVAVWVYTGKGSNAAFTPCRRPAPTRSTRRPPSP